MNELVSMLGMCAACGMQTRETVVHYNVELCPSCREQCECPRCERNADIKESVRLSDRHSFGPSGY